MTRRTSVRKKNIKGRLGQLMFKHSKLLVGLIVVISVSMVGTYYFLASDALSSEFGSPFMDASNITPGGPTYATGTKINVPYRAGLQNKSSQNLQVVLYIGYNTNLVKLDSVACHSPYGCSKSTWNGDYSQIRAGDLHKNHITVCLNFPNPGGYYSTMNILSLQFSAVKDFDSYTQSWVTLQEGYAYGSCLTNPSASGVSWQSGRGSCAYDRPTVYGCDVNGSGPGGGEGEYIGFTPLGGSNDKTPTKNPGDSTNPNSTSGKGGSSSKSGASANKSGSSTATIPSSTTQGTTDQQATITPSPFYDGKLYQAGSDEKNMLGSVSVAGRSVNTAWIALIVSVLTTAALSVVGWRWWNKKQRKRIRR